MAHHTSIYRTTIYRAGAWLSLVLLAGGLQWVQSSHTRRISPARLNAYYSNHDDCLFPSAIRFPYEASTAGADKDTNIERLDAAGGRGLAQVAGRQRYPCQAI